MNNRSNFGRVSIENMAKQPDVIAETLDLIVSRKPNTVREYSFDFRYPHIIEGIGFTFCTRGSAKININLTEYNITANMLGILVPNSVIEVVEQSDDLQIEFLFFSFDFISNMHIVNELGEIASRVEKQACIYLEDERFYELLDFHQIIVKEYEQPAAYRTEIVKSLLHTLVYKVLQCYSELEIKTEDKAQSRHDAIYRRFMSLLFEHYRTERNVQFYADKLYLTPKYFSKVIKNTSGKTAGEWIDEMVIMGAKGMLKSSDLTVAQIADELNFANPSFFGSYFKKTTGMTPLQYRGV
ncbi:helix-turn-helix domain-containing protein [Olivibacter sitiensis]|uniref:helix-turn-helix domain-containing protein n=1 Tax=Olivibacter sitiensis TaxID=376470 RepID=UPI0004259934|nr:helix-turn-helix domain-containing protein [Olivibacter sitiensis]